VRTLSPGFAYAAGEKARTAATADAANPSAKLRACLMALITSN
jgi:hypothetical protein